MDIDLPEFEIPVLEDTEDLWSDDEILFQPIQED
jgi:hypothetical protein